MSNFPRWGGRTRAVGLLPRPFPARQHAVALGLELEELRITHGGVCCGKRKP